MTEASFPGVPRPERAGGAEICEIAALEGARARSEGGRGELDQCLLQRGAGDGDAHRSFPTPMPGTLTHCATQPQ